jgi:dipeptidyl aminopeptidase/acylaminoacyl peptidase
MTSWIVGHSDRFNGGRLRTLRQSVRLGVGVERHRLGLKGYMGVFLYEDVDAYLALSPATYARDIQTTPLLILHSEDDLALPDRAGRASLRDVAAPQSGRSRWSASPAVIATS